MLNRSFPWRKHPRLPIRPHILPVLLLLALLPGLLIHLTTPTTKGRDAVTALCQDRSLEQCLELRFDTIKEITSALHHYDARRVTTQKS